MRQALRHFKKIFAATGVFSMGFLFAGSSSSLISTYQASNTTKVVFSKSNFYSNHEPVNSIGCAGDVKNYFDPQLDRVTPAKPAWLRNISVDITNANAPFGASQSFLCSYGAAQSSAPPECLGPLPPAHCNSPPPPTNCAAFDDMQQLTGYRTKAYLIGGYANDSCSAGTCTRQYSPSIYEILIDDTSNVATPSSVVQFTRQPSGMTVPEPTTSAGLALNSTPVLGDWSFDELHEWILGYGGVNDDSTGADIADTIIRLYQRPAPQSTSDPSIPGIEALDISSAHSTAYDNILTDKAGVAGLRRDTSPTSITNMSNPGGRLGHSFTHISRRDAGMHRRLAALTAGQTDGGVSCAAGNYCVLKGEADSSDSGHGWEDSDYFVSIGGITSTTTLSSAITALIPHRMHTQTGDIVRTGRDAMSWEWLNHWNTATDSHIHRVISLRTDGTLPDSTNPTSGWDFDDRFGRTDGLFPARAFHKSAYDARNNRVYIFGGLITNDASGNGDTTTVYHNFGTVTATNLTPTSETWIYDAPHAGRRPTLGCRVTSSMGSTSSLPGLIRSRYNNTNVELTDLASFSSADLEYETNTALFPPGGCMQFAQPLTDTAAPATTADDGGTAQNYEQPPMRLEHMMAFDDRQGAVIMFGGCTKAPPFVTSLEGDLTTTPTPIAYDPLRGCTSRSDYLNDTWLYIPPTSLESALVTPLSVGSTTYTQGRPDLIAPLDQALLGLPLIYPNGSTTISTAEVQSYTNGTWIKLTSDSGLTTQSSSTLPLARASGAFWYDKAHGKFYMFGGQTCSGCVTNNGMPANAPLLNDLWEFTPPNLANCDRTTASCSSSGTWRLITNNSGTHSFSTPASTTDYPAPVRNAAGVYATRAPGGFYHHGDGFYSVSDSACEGQGPILGSPSTSKERVGAVYVDIDRTQFATTENLLINIKLLPYAPASYDALGADLGTGTKLPGYDFNGTYGASTADDRDQASESDRAYIRVTLLRNPYSSAAALFSQLQPRFRAYQAPGTTVIAQEFDIASNGTGQPLEKQIFIPLSALDSSLNLIKIERVRGSVKFYDMTVTKF